MKGVSSRLRSAAAFGGLLLAVAVASPLVGAAPAKFESTIAAPAHDAGPELFADACPKGNDLEGVSYALFDLKADYTNFKSYGPKHLINEPDPAGAYHDINDYDIDMYAFDAKCRDITPSGANGPAGTEKFVTKRPARYIVLAYWSGIHADLPVTVEAANTKIP